MSKKKSTGILDRVSKSPERWDAAITEAAGLIGRYEAKVAELRRAIKAFEAMKQHGAPFPAEKSVSKEEGDVRSLQE